MRGTTPPPPLSHRSQKCFLKSALCLYFPSLFPSLIIQYVTRLPHSHTVQASKNRKSTKYAYAFSLLKYFFSLQFTANLGRVLLIYLYSINKAICRPSDHSMERPRGPRFELGTGGSSGRDH